MYKDYRTDPFIITNTVGKVLVPASPESFSCDWDGNLASDGRFIYTWDSENRLLAVTNLSTLPALARKALTFTYDSLSRRTSKTVYTNNGSSFVASYTNYFVYDGWNLVAVLGPQSTVLQSFSWGTDLSGSLQGAGGVGGLQSLEVHSGPNAGAYFPCYDGNGNVMALVNAADSTISAQYEYSPFGEMLRATGPMAAANPFRFSTKFQDDETGLLYYGYRYCDPSTGRWNSRDPIGEEEAVNLYEHVGNEPLNQVDLLGERIVSLEIHHTGKAEIDDNAYFAQVKAFDSYHNQIIGGELGFKFKQIPAFEESYYDPGWAGQTTITRPARSAVGFKFEYVVHRICQSDDFKKDFKITQTIVRYSFYKRKSSKSAWQETTPWYYPPWPDGPSLIRYFPDLPKVKVVAGDMPRYIVDKGDRWAYRLHIEWRVRAEDADNAWEGRHYITLYFTESGGTGTARITESPHEVTKLESISK